MAEPSGTLRKHFTQPSEKDVAAPIKKTFKRNSPHRHQKTNGASHVGGGGGGGGVGGAEAKTRGRGGEEFVLVPAWLAISLLTAYVVAGALLFR